MGGKRTATTPCGVTNPTSCSAGVTVGGSRCPGRSAIADEVVGRVIAEKRAAAIWGLAHAALACNQACRDRRGRAWATSTTITVMKTRFWGHVQPWRSRWRRQQQQRAPGGSPRPRPAPGTRPHGHVRVLQTQTQAWGAQSWRRQRHPLSPSCEAHRDHGWRGRPRNRKSRACARAQTQTQAWAWRAQRWRVVPAAPAAPGHESHCDQGWERRPCLCSWPSTDE